MVSNFPDNLDIESILLLSIMLQFITLSNMIRIFWSKKLHVSVAIRKGYVQDKSQTSKTKTSVLVRTIRPTNTKTVTFLVFSQKHI
jgi:hypothetical protein